MSGRAQSPENNLVLMGRIGAAHGVRGEVRIQSFTQNPLAIASYGPLETKKAGPLEITKARMAKNMVVASLKGIADRNAAEKLNGTELFLPRNRLPETGDEGEYYQADLIGLDARLADGTSLGKVLSFANYGAGDLIEIGKSSGNSALYPFTKLVVPEIDLDKGYLVVAPPEEIIVEGEE